MRKTILWKPYQCPLETGDTPLPNPGMVAVTDEGLLPLYEKLTVAKSFNLWVGDTNFPITDGVLSIIDNVEGVEALERPTRYRMRVATGRAFDSRKVLRTINELLECNRDFRQPTTALEAARRYLVRRYPCWSIVVKPGTVPNQQILSLKGSFDKSSLDIDTEDCEQVFLSSDKKKSK